MQAMPTPFSRYVTLLAFGVVVCLADISLAEPQLFWQFEAGQGLFFAPQVDPYTFSAQVHPSVGIGPVPRNFLLGASLAAVYDNPDWSLMWGGRLVLYVYKLTKKPIDSGPSITYGTLHLMGSVLMEKAELRRVAGGLVIDVLEGSMLLSPRVGYDRKSKRTFLEVGLGMGY